MVCGHNCKNKATCKHIYCCRGLQKPKVAGTAVKAKAVKSSAKAPKAPAKVAKASVKKSKPKRSKPKSAKPAAKSEDCLFWEAHWRSLRPNGEILFYSAKAHC